MNEIPAGTPINLARHSGLLQTGAQDKLKEMSISIIGAGAIGSWLMPALAKIGCENVTFFDFDIVEEVNMANQLYGPKLINKKKVEALQWIDNEQYETPFKYVDKEVTKENVYDDITEIVVAAVDSISVRKILFDACKESDIAQLYLDCRIGRYNAQGYSVQPHDFIEVEHFEKYYIFPQDEAAAIPCTERTIIMPCMWCAAFITSQIVSYANNAIKNNVFRLEYDWKTHRTIHNKRQQIMEHAMGV